MNNPELKIPTHTVSDSGCPERSVWAAFLPEWKLWLPFSILTFFLASLLMSGWPNGLIPNLQYPYIYGGDGLASLALVKKGIEGVWFFFNNRLGFPFGSNTLDYPIPDTGSLILLKTLGTFVDSPQAVFNLFFLLGFPVVFIFSYVFFRAIGLFRPFSVSAALLFTFLPFHIERLGHVFFTWYFVVPIFFYFGFRVFSQRPVYLFGKYGWRRIALSLLALLVAASFGVYYAFFGCLLVSVAALAGAVKHRSHRSLFLGGSVLVIVFFGFLLNTAPSIAYRLSATNAGKVAKRGAAESEVYGLKLTQMLLPHQNHRVRFLRKMAAGYARKFPLVNENATAALGLVGACGLISLLSIAFVAMSGRVVDPRLAFLGIVTLFLFLFSTIGGFSTLFSLLISPQLRGWNRVSVFIGFGSITAIFLLTQIWVLRFFSKPRIKRVILFLASALGVFGFFEQTNTVPVAAADSIRRQFESDRTFFMRVEQLLPAGSAIYQLPYMAFPEVPPIHKLGDYELLVGFLHSASLRWSYGGIKKGRGDVFFCTLSSESLEKQIETVRKLGFAGVYVDRRGFQDGARETEIKLRQILGSGPHIISDDGNALFFMIPNPIVQVDAMSSIYDIYEESGLAIPESKL